MALPSVTVVGYVQAHSGFWQTLALVTGARSDNLSRLLTIHTAFTSNQGLSWKKAAACAIYIVQPCLQKHY